MKIHMFFMQIDKGGCLSEKKRPAKLKLKFLFYSETGELFVERNQKKT